MQNQQFISLLLPFYCCYQHKSHWAEWTKEQKATTEQFADFFFLEKNLDLSIVDREHKNHYGESVRNFIKTFRLQKNWS